MQMDGLETDLSTLAAVVKRTPNDGVKPTSACIKRLWLAHEKLGDIYSADEKIKRAE
jgi:hypothetical protein